ncbi:MAG: response regulator [Candidatus Sabulitectum sp.]|nr:response regulator [Candidatus Sabulitectum sp.]
MISDVLMEKLRRAERRIAFVATQTVGVMSSELTEALKEIRFIISALSPEENKSNDGSITVLFVDDEEIIRRIGTQILTRDGYKVLTANDGIEALGIYEQNKDTIKCIILDLVMPRLDGMQTFRQLRRSAPDLGIILTTGYGEEEIRKRFGGLKLQGFLRKPFSAGSLSKMVKKAIGFTDEKG